MQFAEEVYRFPSLISVLHLSRLLLIGHSMYLHLEILLRQFAMLRVGSVCLEGIHIRICLPCSHGQQDLLLKKNNFLKCYSLDEI